MMLQEKINYLLSYRYQSPDTYFFPKSVILNQMRLKNILFSFHIRDLRHSLSFRYP